MIINLDIVIIFIKLCGMDDNARKYISSAPFDNCKFPPPDFLKITGDENLSAVLVERWGEINRCLESDAHLAGIILMGGVIEAVLLAIVKRYHKKARECKAVPRDRNKRIKKLRDWTLNELIDVAYECGWIHGETAEFSHLLRKYRNLVHPWEEVAGDYETPTKGSCSICWKTIRAALYDLEQLQ